MWERSRNDQARQGVVVVVESGEDGRLQGRGRMRQTSSKRCADWWERRAGRLIAATGQCKRMTAHPSGYCKAHRWSYRWTEAQEIAFQKSKAHTESA